MGEVCRTSEGQGLRYPPVTFPPGPSFLDQGSWFSPNSRSNSLLRERGDKGERR